MKSVLTTLSGDEQLQLRAELELLKDSFSLVEFDDEEVDEKKGPSLSNADVDGRCWGDIWSDSVFIFWFQMKMVRSLRGSWWRLWRVLVSQPQLRNSAR